MQKLMWHSYIWPVKVITIWFAWNNNVLHMKRWTNKDMRKSIIVTKLSILIFHLSCFTSFVLQDENGCWIIHVKYFYPYKLNIKVCEDVMGLTWIKYLYVQRTKPPHLLNCFWPLAVKCKKYKFRHTFKFKPI